MSGNIKAIETIYNNYRFRSRLEARWAVFMDELGVEYRYEPEGFDLDGIRYLPDFYLPQLQCWMEIKPDVPTNEEREKAIRLCIARKETVAIFSGDPWFDVVGYGFRSWTHQTRDNVTKMISANNQAKYHWLTTTECITFLPSAGWLACFDILREYAWCLTQWHECTHCHDITINSLDAVCCRCGTTEYGYNETPRLVAAYTAARQARFEFGR